MDPGGDPAPSGAVTFLLTDVVGSTRLWEVSPTDMARALARHDEIVDEVVDAHGGEVIKPRGEGDSTFSVFRRPTEAAGAALALQEALAVEAWPARTPIRARMAIHTGEAIGRAGSYYGPVVNRVARLRATANPGQILVTAAVADGVADQPPEGAALRPVGLRSLRGLTRPEYVYRLERGDAPAPPAALAEIAEAGGVPPFPPRLAAVAGPAFVARQRELATLRRLAGEAAEGGVRLALVSGEPGIGKTRLAAEAARVAHDDGMTVLYGRCDEELGIPYQPFVEALRHYVVSAPQRTLDTFAARHGGDLARLVPELADHAAWLSTPAVSDPETERYLLFEAVIRLLEAASGDAPVLLVLDDLHWADRNTLLLLRQATQSAAALRVMIVGAYRQPHAPGTSLAEVQPDLAPAAVRLVLAGLAGDELCDFVIALAGQDLDERGTALVRWLHRETDGNPFFAVEILRHLADSGAVRRQGNTWVLVTEVEDLQTPASVMEVIQQRVARLGDGVQRALTTAAVIGREFDIELLAATLDAAEDDILTALERASGAALVEEVSAGRFSFSHALVGNSLYDGVGATRRARLHRRVAEQLEVLCGGDPGDRVAELAAHWLAAGVPGESARTIEYARRSGDRALDRLAPDEAVRWYGEALAVADSTGAGDGLRCQLLISLGVAQRQTGDGTFRATLLEAAELAERLGERDALVQAALANNRGDRAVSGRVDRERIAVLGRALGAVGQADSPARARLLATLALESNFGEGWEEQVAFSDEALAIARRVEDPATLAAVLSLRHETIRLPHTLAERLANTAEHLELAEQLGDPVQIGFAALWRSRACWECGDVREVDRCMARVAELAAVHPYLRWTAAIHWSCRHLLDGRITEAEDATQQSFRLGQAIGQPDAGAIYAAQIVSVRWDQGRLGEMLPLLEQAVAENRGIPGFRALLALACCESGATERARELFEHEAASGFAAFRYDPIWLCSFVLLGEVCVQLGDRARVPALYERLAPWRDQNAFSGVSLYGSVAHYLGRLAATAGRHDVAEADFARATGRYEEMGAVTFLARTRRAAAALPV